MFSINLIIFWLVLLAVRPTRKIALALAPWLAFFWLMLLWVLIIFTVWRFFHVNKVAAWMMVPYLLWVTFAAYLNLAVAIINVK